MFIYNSSENGKITFVNALYNKSSMSEEIIFWKGRTIKIGVLENILGIRENLKILEKLFLILIAY